MKKVLAAAGLALAFSTVAYAAQGTFRIGLQDDPDTLDPIASRTFSTRIVLMSLCDRLLHVNNKLEFTPGLATSWNWSDGDKTLTLKLREGLLFHDGTAIDAQAVKANLERTMTRRDSLRKSDLASIDHIDATGPLTVAIHLKHPDAPLLATLSDAVGMMLSPKSFEGDASISKHPVCSGPYKFVNRVQNDHIELEKFKRYYDAADYHFDRVRFNFFPDATVRLQNLQAGQLDLVNRLNPSDIDTVKKDPRLAFITTTGLGFKEFVFNINHEPNSKTNPFANRLVRQAFQLAIDRDAINSGIGNGTYIPAQQAFPPLSPYYNEKYTPTKRDVAKAKALLKEAGMPNVTAKLSFGNNTENSMIAEAVQAMVAEAGIQLKLVPVEGAAMLAAESQGRFDIDLRIWSGRVDPDGNIQPFVACGGFLNQGKYCNEEADKLVKEARMVSDVTKRKAIYARIQDIFQHDLPDVYVYYLPWSFAASEHVRGFHPHPDGLIRLKGVTVEN